MGYFSNNFKHNFELSVANRDFNTAVTHSSIFFIICIRSQPNLRKYFLKCMVIYKISTLIIILYKVYLINLLWDH